jgi:acetyl esterase/lipase
LSVDTRRLAVAAESAGGGLAAALAIAMRDHGRIPLRF